MRRTLTPRGLAIALALAIVALPASAGAKKYQMSGSWFSRNGQVFIPLQFALSTIPHKSMGTGTLFGMGVATQPFPYHFPPSLPIGPMGTLIPVSAIFGPFVIPLISHTTLVIGMGLGVPNGGILGSGNVSATTAMTMGPGRQVAIPRHRWKKNTSQVVPLNGANLLQITTNFTFDAPFHKAVLASMGGPGSQTWCLSNPLCLTGGMASIPGGGGWPPGALSNNGRIIYRKGPRQFGGSIQMGLKGFGDNAIPVAQAPLRVAHLLFGSVDLISTRVLVPGHQLQHQVGMGTMRVPAIPATEVVHLTPAFETQPVMTSAGLIITPGPKVTTMGGLTNTMMGPLLRTFTETTTNYGLSFTTGTVFVQNLTGEGPAE